MAGENTVTLIGNLTREPEIRYTREGQAACNFGIAVNKRFQKNGEWEEQTSYFDVVCWRELAENVSMSLVKGARVVVTGRLEQRSWETNEGEKRYKIEVVADDIGPSLRWATAEVLKNRRDDGRSSGRSTGRSHAETSAGYGQSEEPF